MNVGHFILPVRLLSECNLTSIGEFFNGTGIRTMDIPSCQYLCAQNGRFYHRYLFHQVHWKVLCRKPFAKLSLISSLFLAVLFGRLLKTGHSRFDQYPRVWARSGH